MNSEYPRNSIDYYGESVVKAGSESEEYEFIDVEDIEFSLKEGEFVGRVSGFGSGASEDEEVVEMQVDGIFREDDEPSFLEQGKLREW